MMTNLKLNITLAGNYQSQSQVVRVLTENWVSQNSFCPNCGQKKLTQFNNNKPVADFNCEDCNQEYELKSKCGSLGNKITDGAYSTMLNRIGANNNPNFFFLTYSKSWCVENFMIIPRHFFVSDIIEKRKPLADTARRAGWIGCNILLNQIPSSGRVFFVENSRILSKDSVLKKWQQTCFLQNESQKAKGWLLDTMNCVDAIKKETFTLNDMYKYELALKVKYPDNNYIKEKLRQQLQILRDKGLLEFLQRGVYRKIKIV